MTNTPHQTVDINKQKEININLINREFTYRLGETPMTQTQDHYTAVD